ncbi:MAG: hypothetical protein QNJ88_00815 [Acidimicrobiia bacterium]|nr:hypothetical protein [Acidimicrobiia bacterium]
MKVRLPIVRTLAVGAVVVALASCGGDGEQATTTLADPVTSVPPVTVAPSTTSLPATSSTTTTAAPTLADPPEFDRWTTILASLPVDEWDETAATEEAFTMVDLGTGLLRSEDYPSLNPGYWVVFSGDFATQEEALAHCRLLQEQDVGCYHRFLGEAPVIVAGLSERTMVAWVDSVLAVVDVDTGATVHEVTDFYAGGGVFPGALQLGNDGTGVFFGVGFEDFWYSCDASVGRIDYVDLTTAERTEVAAGAGPSLSPDGSRLAYVASSICIPDPDRENEVIAFFDSVAVLDLVTGRTQTWGPSPGTAQTPQSAVASLAWDTDGNRIFVAMEEGSLRVVDTRVGAALDATTSVGSGRTDTGFGTWVLEGVTDTGTLLLTEVDYATNTSRVIEIDRSSGSVVRADSWLDGYWTVRLDASGSARLLNSLTRVSGLPAGDLGPDPAYSGADW